MISIWKKTTLIISLVGLLSACGGDSGGSDLATSVNGSTSGMVYQNGYLVTLRDSGRVSSYDLTDPAKPVLRYTLYVNFVETLSVQGADNVLVGASDGSYRLQVGSDGTLTQLSFASHTRSCDPAIGDGNRMYVTVRAGNRCGDDSEDRLLIYDTSSASDSWLLGTLPLPQPQGLALSESALYVCTSAGLQEVDVRNPLQPAAANLYPALNCNDLIVQGNEVVLSADNGITLATLDQLATPSAQIMTGQ
ncbi:MAG: hypothetical protein LRY66_05245 [Saccharospirillaceae bacterium]|nr:hypothetical protein [Saccharospirillaceae bacterium]MCD8530762.1 hypothetical protein [Saccharospirillaceae bacterium]